LAPLKNPLISARKIEIDFDILIIIDARELKAK
jgi:hypothetical protein